MEVDYGIFDSFENNGKSFRKVYWVRSLKPSEHIIGACRSAGVDEYPLVYGNYGFGNYGDGIMCL